MAEELLVDPAISRAKFEHELATYRQLEDDHMRRGWWLLAAEFPEVFIVFATARVKPPAVVFGAVLNFSNYDLWPPSVRLVDPFTREPYAQKALPNHLLRRVPTSATQGVADGEAQVQALMQAHSENDVPFLCVPGVREYHQHPGHSGDSWLLHRGRGEGTLFFLIEKLYQYGVQPIDAYEIRMVPQIRFGQSQVPE